MNQQLVGDLGGRHSAKSEYVDLDRLGLTDGATYPLDFFISERRTKGSQCGNDEPRPPGGRLEAHDHRALRSIQELLRRLIL